MNDFRYEKCKVVVDALLKGNVISNDNLIFEDHDISRSIENKIFTALKKANLIIKPSREEKIFNRKIIDNEFFPKKDLNSILISSVVSCENSKQAVDTLEYVFKSTPKRLFQRLTIAYSDALDKRIFENIEPERYMFFVSLIEEYQTRPIVCEIEKSSPLSCKNIIAPVRMFFFENTIYLFAINVENEKKEFIDIKEISSAEIINSSYRKILLSNDIQVSINDFCNMQRDDDISSITIVVSPVFLNFMLKNKLIDNYELLEKVKFGVVEKSISIPMSQKEIDKYQQEMEKEKKEGKVYFDEDKVFGWKVKITAPKSNLIFLSKMYMNHLEFIEYKSIKKELKKFFSACDDHSTFWHKIRSLVWIIITFVIAFIIGKSLS